MCSIRFAFRTANRCDAARVRSSSFSLRVLSLMSYQSQYSRAVHIREWGTNT
jgi:hypothetical protein